MKEAFDPKLRAVSFKLADNPDLFTALNRYRISRGITWNRFWLEGLAYGMAKEGSNTDLVMQIADYLETKR